MAAEKDYSFLIGNTYGHLTVLERSEPVVKPSGKKEKAYRCICDCGNVVDVAAWAIASGHKTSCGHMKEPSKIIGKRFGRLTVLRRVEDKHFPNGSYQTVLECLCDCGNKIKTTSGHLRSGHTLSCGCYCIDKTVEANTRHGYSKSRIYNVWCSMKERCYTDGCCSYKYYGGRGIKVCDEWKDFENFRKWAYDNGYDENADRGQCTIDRIDVDGDYCPDNCRWVTVSEQAVNKRNNHYITINGVTQTLSHWCRIYDVSMQTVHKRLRRGWSEFDAITIKPNHKREDRK